MRPDDPPTTPPATTTITISVQPYRLCSPVSTRKDDKARPSLKWGRGCRGGGGGLGMVAAGLSGFGSVAFGGYHHRFSTKVERLQMRMEIRLGRCRRALKLYRY